MIAALGHAYLEFSPGAATTPNSGVKRIVFSAIAAARVVRCDGIAHCVDSKRELRD